MASLALHNKKLSYKKKNWKVKKDLSIWKPHGKPSPAPTFKNLQNFRNNLSPSLSSHLYTKGTRNRMVNNFNMTQIT